MKASKVKWLIGGVLVIALAAVGGFTFYNSGKKVEYITAKIQRGDIDSTISAPARMIPECSASDPIMNPETSCTNSRGV